MNLFVALVLFLIPLSSFGQSNPAFYEKLAYYHVPLHFQQVGFNPKSEVVTNFDFDGDWVGNNNWDNEMRFPTFAHVYYDVKETSTHYFINFGYFHPRDNKNRVCAPYVCHENDLEGSLLTIQKDGSLYGHVVAVSELAHTSITTHKSVASPDPKLVGAGDHPRICLFSEKGGHGLRVWNPLEMKDFANSDEVQLYTMAQVSKVIPTLYGKKWLIFYGTGVSEYPNGATEGVFQFSLLTIFDSFWARRDQVGSGKVFLGTFDYKGARYSIKNVPSKLDGEKWTRGAVSAPWGWHSAFEKHRGDFFFDPAYYMSTRMTKVPNYSLTYLFNPYIQ